MKELGHLLSLTTSQLKHRQRIAKKVYELFSICGPAYLGQVQEVTLSRLDKLTNTEWASTVKRLKDHFQPEVPTSPSPAPTLEELMLEIFGSPSSDSLSPLNILTFQEEEELFASTLEI